MEIEMLLFIMKKTKIKRMKTKNQKMMMTNGTFMVKKKLIISSNSSSNANMIKKSRA